MGSIEQNCNAVVGFQSHVIEVLVETDLEHSVDWCD